MRRYDVYGVCVVREEMRREDENGQKMVEPVELEKTFGSGADDCARLLTSVWVASTEAPSRGRATREGEQGGVRVPEEVVRVVREANKSWVDEKCVERGWLLPSGSNGKGAVVLTESGKAVVSQLDAAVVEAVRGRAVEWVDFQLRELL